MEPEDDKTQTHATLTRDTMVGHYRIIEKIGAGGMGEVYLAQDTELDRKVALKFLPPHLCQDEDSRKRFKREAQAAAALKHPNIVTIYEVSEYDGRPYFAMEHIEGHSLHYFAHEKQLPIEKVIDLAIQICGGLGKAHQAGVIHRDIKTSNIVVDDDGRPKVLDFGLASVKGEEKITRTGSTLGTVAYMSPEQVKGERIDQRSDLFSLGIVLYELIAGRTPFRRDHEAATLQAIMQDTLEPLSRYKADVPEGVQEIVNRALDKDMETRYQTAAGMAADLRREKKILDSGESAIRHSKARSRTARFIVPGLILITGALLLILKPWKIEVQPTMEVVAAENRLAVMYFDNLADPQDTLRWGEIAANLLMTDLSESQYVQVVSSQRLYDILKQLGREGQKNIDRSVASQIAEKARAKWMLLGSILKIEPQIILTAQLVEVASGNAIASQRIEGQPGEEIFTLVDKLTVEIKSDLALPDSAQAEPDRPVAEVTTHSPEAYRYYLEGVNLGFKFYRAEATKSLKQALSYDSTFAMAYYRLSAFSRGVERRQLAAKALEYSAKASRDEQGYIKGWNEFVLGNHTQAINDIREIIDRHPDDKEAWQALGYIYKNGLRQTKEAIDCYSKAIEIDSLDAWAYNELAYAYNNIGDFEKSIWAINKYVSLAPNEPNPYDSRGELYASNGKLDQAIASFKKAVEIKSDFYDSWEHLGTMLIFKRDYAEAERCFEKLLLSTNKNVRSDGRQDLALIPLYQGKFDEALAVLDQSIGADKIERVDTWEKHMIKSDIFAQRGEFAKSLGEINEAIKGYTNSYPGRAVPFKHIYIQRLTENGEFAKAQQVAREWKREIEDKDPTKMDFYLIGLGCLEFGQENYDTAIGRLSKAMAGIPDPLTPYGFRVRFLLARAYQKAGQVGEAVAEFEKILTNYSGGRIAWAISSVKTHYYLGLAYDKSGWNNKAIEQYRIFLDIWRDADSGIVEIADARERLARLTATL